MIAIIDYEMGNVSSVANMLKRIGHEAVVTRDADVILSADRLILPGVGAFDKGMQNIKAYGLREVLDEAVLKQRKPVLGICLGMQIMTNSSEEGSEPGLGWVDATSVKFRFSDQAGLKVPHMGWNYVKPVSENTLFSDERSRFYFVHGYYVQCASSADVIATAHYGFDFACAIGRDNVMGVQFHPEKSHRFGMKLLQGFATG
jgi:glutamine amidotransferase